MTIFKATLKRLFREKLNILFLIAAFLSGGIIMVLAFLLWLIFLIFSLKNTKSLLLIMIKQLLQKI